MILADPSGGDNLQPLNVGAFPSTDGTLDLQQWDSAGKLILRPPLQSLKLPSFERKKKVKKIADFHGRR